MVSCHEMDEEINTEISVGDTDFIMMGIAGTA
jgi:hypothetical protein